MIPELELEWFCKHLAAHRLGVLDGEDQRRFEAAAAGNPACRAALDDFVAATTSPATTHIPAHVIARWDRALQDLPPLQRQMTVQHVRRCGSCRAELEFLGFDLQPALTEADPVDLVAVARDRRSKVQPAAIGYAWAALASLTAMILLAQNLAYRAAPRLAAAITVGPLGQARVTLGSSRGDGTLVALSAATRDLYLELPPLAAPVSEPLRGQQATVELAGPGIGRSGTITVTCAFDSLLHYGGVHLRGEALPRGSGRHPSRTDLPKLLRRGG